MANCRYIMSEVGTRIKEAAEKVGGMNRLADLASIPRRTLGDYVSGATEPKASALVAIATATDSDLNWLLRPNYPAGLVRGGVGGAYLSAHVLLPRYDVRASAGAGALVATGDPAEYMSVGRDWLRRNLPAWAPPNATVGILEGSGDSMEPTIRDGDLIMVVHDVEWRIVERGGIFVFSLDEDRLLLKRLQVLNNGDLNIISDNPAYGTDRIAFEDIQYRVRVHGEVFFCGGKPRRI